MACSTRAAKSLSCRSTARDTAMLLLLLQLHSFKLNHQCPTNQAVTEVRRRRSNPSPTGALLAPACGWAPSAVSAAVLAAPPAAAEGACCILEMTQVQQMPTTLPNRIRCSAGMRVKLMSCAAGHSLQLALRAGNTCSHSSNRPQQFVCSQVRPEVSTQHACLCALDGCCSEGMHVAGHQPTLPSAPKPSQPATHLALQLLLHLVRLPFQQLHDREKNRHAKGCLHQLV